MSELPPWLIKMNERRLAIIVTLFMLLPLLRPGCTAHVEDLSIAAGVSLSTGFLNAPEVIIAAVNERATDEMGPLPWPRATMARAIDQLYLMNAGAIAVDAGLVRTASAAESRQRARDEDGSIVAGYKFYATLADLPSGYEFMAGEAKSIPVSGELALPQSPADDSPMLAMAGIDFDTLMPSGMRVSLNGFSNIFPDADGVVRNQPLAVRMKHRVYPCFAAAAAAAAQNFTPLISEDAAGRPDGVKLGDVKVDTAPDTEIALNFRGKAGTFPRVSISDVISGKLAPETVMGRIVLIGATDSSQAQIFATPLGDMPTIEIAANALDTILRNEPIMPLTGRPWLIAFVAAAGLAFAAAFARLSVIKRVVCSLAVIVLIWLAAIAVYVFAGTLIPAVHVSAAIAILLAVTLAWRVTMVEIPRRTHGRAFSMRMSQESLARAFADPAAFDRLGRECELSACAIDIRGFASIAHPLSSDLLCSMMRAYRTLMANALLKHGAFIESWAGDECRAVFGAPLSQKDHALIACKAAFEAIKAITSAAAEIERRYGLKKVRLGIGIASGTASVGELGPRGADNFGMIGGTIEAAVMLRSLNRTYRTAILVDDMTRAASEGAFAFRPLDPVMLPGEEKSVVIHELLGPAGVILPQLEEYLTGRDAYLCGDFEKAIHILSRLLEAHPHDGPSQLFLYRARGLMNSPPNSRWTGVWGRR